MSTISFDDLDEVLRGVGGLTPGEREYVRGVFARYRSSGISEHEVERAMRELRREGSDNIGRSEADRVKDALLAYLHRE